MRWDDLFDDLESQLERELSAEEVDLEAEEERLRLGRLSVRDRIVAVHESGGGPVTVILEGGARLRVAIVSTGRDWFSADIHDGSSRRTQCIVPIAALAGVALDARDGLGLATREGESGHPSLPSRLGIAFVLRDLCRRRRAVDVMLSTGEVHGTIDRVGRDHFDLAVHDPGSLRRESAVRELRVVPLSALRLVRL